MNMKNREIMWSMNTESTVPEEFEMRSYMRQQKKVRLAYQNKRTVTLTAKMDVS